jgi:hypothetical protein
VAERTPLSSSSSSFHFAHAHVAGGYTHHTHTHTPHTHTHTHNMDGWMDAVGGPQEERGAAAQGAGAAEKEEGQGQGPGRTRRTPAPAAAAGAARCRTRRGRTCGHGKRPPPESPRLSPGGTCATTNRPRTTTPVTRHMAHATRDTQWPAVAMASTHARESALSIYPASPPHPSNLRHVRAN